MNKLKNALSDMLSLIVPKENKEIYSWSELIFGFVLIALLAFAISLLPK